MKIISLAYLAVTTLLCSLITITSVVAQTLAPEIPKPEVAATTSSPRRNDSDQLIILPVGVNLGKQNVIPSTLVRGFEDGSQAINFQTWLIPLDDVIQGLKLDVKPLEDGQLEVRSPGLVTRINPEELPTDPELGLVIPVKTIQTLLGVPTEFDMIEYAITFNPPWLNLRRKGRRTPEIPVVLEGLSEIDAPAFSISAIRQRVNISGRGGGSSSVSNSTNYSGEFTTVGTLLGGSWFLRTRQPDLTDTGTFRLQEAQYFRQTDAADFVLGSQPTFWRNQGTGQYWGATTIQRWGFTPPLSRGGFSPTQRLQANDIGRSITGEAEPGTLVQLTQGFNDVVVDEILVDSSGVYRFENVITGRGGSNTYRVFLYPDGQLTAEPEIREANFSTLPGQLTKGASALVVSTGLSRESSQNGNFFGEFTDVRGGIAYRLGVTEDLTLGMGVVYDESVLGLGELFYQPAGFPLKVKVSALLGTEDEGIDYDASINFQPSPKLSFNFNSDSLAQRFRVNWQVFRGLTLRASGNTREEALAAGMSISQTSQNFSLFASADIDTNNNKRWSLRSNLGSLRLSHRGNEITTNSELIYYLSDSSASKGHSLLLGYETRDSNNRDDHLARLAWRYRSPQQSSDGRYLWDLDFGYGFGSRGNGLIASASSAVIPGLVLRLRYQEISTTSDGSTFRIELSPNINVQSGISGADTRFDRLRSRGGLLIQPFFDNNGNGKRDSGEEIYLEEPDLLLLVNNKSITSFRPDIRNNGIFVKLDPDTYRLDLDPAGYPIDWKPEESAYAVEVVPGSYTPVTVPMVLSYTFAGVVTDAAGEAVEGAKVEAVPVDSGKSIFSITNGAGVFYLEGLQQGKYNLLINGESAQPNQIEIKPDSEPFQELNLSILLSP
ncbi:MAG: carboxypeptidase regulatory-like domain-containing protein [Moorea sp. SIO3G5]|nr:carboxypeptidase regulatory-like domain-containing protein [Moorena sp. SIO3G5]